MKEILILSDRNEVWEAKHMYIDKRNSRVVGLASRDWHRMSRLRVWLVSLCSTLLIVLWLFPNNEESNHNAWCMSSTHVVKAFVVQPQFIVRENDHDYYYYNDVYNKRKHHFSTSSKVSGSRQLFSVTSLSLQSSTRSINPSLVQLGSFIGNGTFGYVRWATIHENPEQEDPQRVVLKKAYASVPNANEYLLTEQYINHRLCLEKSCSRHVAPYMGHVTIKDQDNKDVATSDTKYLVWKASGNQTLQDFIHSSNTQNGQKSMLQLASMLGITMRTSYDQHEVGREVLHQLLSALSYCHALGIVHRDIKPANVLVDPTTQSLQLIDFGSAADMGNWISQKGYRGSERGIRSILYCAPEEFVQAQHPYAFDVYSVAVTWLRLMIPGLRNHNDDTFFNLRMSICKDAQHDLNRWQEQIITSSTLSLPDGWENFFGYCTQGRQAWRLLTSMMQYDPAKRPSASECLLLRSYLNPMCSQTRKQPEPPPIPWSITSHLHKWNKLIRNNNNDQDDDELCILPEEFYGTVVSVEVNLRPLTIQFHPKPSDDTTTTTTTHHHHHGLVVSHAQSSSSASRNHHDDNLIHIGDTLLAIGPMDVDDWTLDHVLQILDKWPRPTVQLQFLRTFD